jgi:MOSC domain-containing protein YiiM
MPFACGLILTNSHFITISKVQSGSVLQVSVSRGGLPKRAISVGDLQPLGIVGDDYAHPGIHGGPQQAVLLISSEAIAELTALGFPLYPGALGENITTIGLDRRLWRIGQRWRIGYTIVELTKVRAPCSALNVYGSGIQKAVYDSQVRDGDPSSARWALSGFYTAVVMGGAIRAGDPISLLSEMS